MSSPDPRHINSVVVIGCGAVGLPLCVAFATRDLNVLGVDIDAERIWLCQSGRLEVAEASLAEALDQSIEQGRLKFTPFCARASHRRAFILARSDACGRSRRPGVDELGELPPRLRWSALKTTISS